MSESRRSRHLGRTFRWYVIQELVFPTTIALAGLTVLVLTRDLLGLSDLIINRDFGVATVPWIAFSKVVPLAARILPFAVLIGALVGIGRLRADREVLAMEAAGVSSRLLVGPVSVSIVWIPMNGRSTQTRCSTRPTSCFSATSSSRRS